MGLVVQKFGGSSVADAQKIFNVAGRITDTYNEGNDVVVVVSAMGDTTDDLIEKANEINKNPSRREMDVLLSTGEQITISLLAMALEKLGYPVVSLTGWQVAMVTDRNNMRARLKKIETQRIMSELDKKKIVIVALVDTLEYLKKGGRVSKTVAFAGGVLNIKPVLSVIDGEIGILGKARGSKMGNNLLVQEIDKAGGIDFTKPVLLGYSGISDALLQKYIEDSRHIWEGNLEEVRYSTVGSVIGTHAGPGAVVVAFFKN